MAVSDSSGMTSGRDDVVLCPLSAGPLLMVLEPRLLLDAALVATLDAVAVDNGNENGAENDAGNELEPPQVVGIDVSTALIDAADIGSVVTVTLTFDRAMDTTQSPFVMFAQGAEAADTVLTRVDAGDWTSPTVFQIAFSVADEALILSNVGLLVAAFPETGPASALPDFLSDVFSIDTVTPVVEPPADLPPTPPPAPPSSALPPPPPPPAEDPVSPGSLAPSAPVPDSGAGGVFSQPAGSLPGVDSELAPAPIAPSLPVSDPAVITPTVPPTFTLAPAEPSIDPLPIDVGLPETIVPDADLGSALGDDGDPVDALFGPIDDALTSTLEQLQSGFDPATLEGGIPPAVGEGFSGLLPSGFPSVDGQAAQQAFQAAVTQALANGLSAAEALAAGEAAIEALQTRSTSEEASDQTLQAESAPDDSATELLEQVLDAVADAASSDATLEALASGAAPELDPSQGLDDAGDHLGAALSALDPQASVSDALEAAQAAAEAEQAAAIVNLPVDGPGDLLLEALTSGSELPTDQISPESTEQARLFAESLLNLLSVGGDVAPSPATTELLQVELEQFGLTGEAANELLDALADARLNEPALAGLPVIDPVAVDTAQPAAGSSESDLLGALATGLQPDSALAAAGVDNPSAQRAFLAAVLDALAAGLPMEQALEAGRVAVDALQAEPLPADLSDDAVIELPATLPDASQAAPGFTDALASAIDRFDREAAWFAEVFTDPDLTAQLPA